MQLSKRGVDWFWADFKYERFPTFCYLCGVIGHTDRFCSKLYDLPPISRDKYMYGPWLRAQFKKPFQSDSRWLKIEADYDSWMTGGLTGGSSGILMVIDPMNQGRDIRS